MGGKSQVAKTNNLEKLYEMGFTTQEIADGLGIATSAVTSARRNKEWRKAFEVAAECLVRRQGGRQAKDTIYICRVPAKHIEAFNLMVRKVLDVEPQEIN